MRVTMATIGAGATFAVAPASTAAVNAVARRGRRSTTARPGTESGPGGTARAVRPVHLLGRRRIWTAIVIGLDRRDGRVGGRAD